MAETNPTAPGKETSEWTLTKILQLAAGVMVAVGASLSALHEQFPDVIWLSVAMTAVGGLVGLLSQLGYVKARTALKATMIQSGLNSTSIIPPPSKPNP